MQDHAETSFPLLREPHVASTRKGETFGETSAALAVSEMMPPSLKTLPFFASMLHKKRGDKEISNPTQGRLMSLHRDPYIIHLNIAL